MARYSVQIRHQVTESNFVVVEARDPKEAEQKALDPEYWLGNDGWKRRPCDGACDGYYVADLEADVQEVPRQPVWGTGPKS